MSNKTFCQGNIENKCEQNFEMSEGLKDFFIEENVNIIAIGAGKTHNCGKLISNNKNNKNNKYKQIQTIKSNTVYNTTYLCFCKQEKGVD